MNTSILLLLFSSGKQANCWGTVGRTIWTNIWKQNTDHHAITPAGSTTPARSPQCDSMVLPESASAPASLRQRCWSGK